MAASAIAKESLLVRIRRETRDLHQKVESTLNFPGPNLTVDRYREILAGFYGFYAPWENMLQPWIEKLNSYGADLHLKCPGLARDLEYFSVDPATVPVCTSVPTIESQAEAIGSLYVREGASLGGQIISRHLESVLGLSEGNGYRFFSSSGRDVGRDWKRFQTILLQCSSPVSDSVVISSARATFESICCWLCGK